MKHHLLLLVFFLLFSCDNKNNDNTMKDDFFVITNDTDNTTNEIITYTSHIKQLLDQNCIRCHSTEKTGKQRNGAPPNINWNTYLEAIKNAERGNKMIQLGFMPPTGGLAQSDRNLFQQWIDDGKLE